MAGRSVSGLSAAQSKSMGMSSTAGAGPSTTPSGKGGSSSGTQGDGVKRIDDVFRLVKERVFGWSYLMQWYQGYVAMSVSRAALLMRCSDVHYLNTVRVSPWTLEQSLGPKALESRSRSFFVLGLSLAALLDETDAAQYCRSLLRVLEEWEAGLDGGGKVVSGNPLVERARTDAPTRRTCFEDRRAASRLGILGDICQNNKRRTLVCSISIS